MHQTIHVLAKPKAQSVIRHFTGLNIITIILIVFIVRIEVLLVLILRQALHFRPTQRSVNINIFPPCRMARRSKPRIPCVHVQAQVRYAIIVLHAVKKPLKTRSQYKLCRSSSERGELDSKTKCVTRLSALLG